MQDEYTLFIPQGIKTRFEFFDGYGKREFITSIIVGLIALIFSIVVYLRTKSFFYASIIELASVAASVIFNQKDNCNQSTILFMKYLIRFSLMQKQYYYKYIGGGTG